MLRKRLLLTMFTASTVWLSDGRMASKRMSRSMSIRVSRKENLTLSMLSWVWLNISRRRFTSCGR